MFKVYRYDPKNERNNGMERSMENDKIAGVVGDYLMCLTLVSREASNGKRNYNCFFMSLGFWVLLGVLQGLLWTSIPSFLAYGVPEQSHGDYL